VRIFITDDLPGLEEAIKKIFSGADWQLCVLHVVRDTLNKAWKKDWEALVEALKKIYPAERQEEAEKALRERWGTVYLKIVERWETKAYALLVFLHHPRSFCRYFYTTKPTGTTGEGDEELDEAGEDAQAPRICRNSIYHAD
jgi:putative transposase